MVARQGTAPCLNFKALRRCVEQIHAGQIWANSSELGEVVEAFRQLAPMRIVNADGLRLLTKREEDVVRLVAEGLQNREIASKLKLSDNTVKNYLFHIFDKLGISSRVELVLYAASSTKSLQTAVQSDEQEREPAGSLKIADELLKVANQSSGSRDPALERRRPPPVRVSQSQSASPQMPSRPYKAIHFQATCGNWSFCF